MFGFRFKIPVVLFQRKNSGFSHYLHSAYEVAERYQRNSACYILGFWHAVFTVVAILGRCASLVVPYRRFGSKVSVPSSKIKLDPWVPVLCPETYVKRLPIETSENTERVKPQINMAMFVTLYWHILPGWDLITNVIQLVNSYKKCRELLKRTYVSIACWYLI